MEVVAVFAWLLGNLNSLLPLPSDIKMYPGPNTQEYLFEIHSLASPIDEIKIENKATNEVPAVISCEDQYIHQTRILDENRWRLSQLAET